jgi:hypothetical protein
LARSRAVKRWFLRIVHDSLTGIWATLDSECRIEAGLATNSCRHSTRVPSTKRLHQCPQFDVHFARKPIAMACPSKLTCPRNGRSSVAFPKMEFPATQASWQPQNARRAHSGEGSPSFISGRRQNDGLSLFDWAEVNVSKRQRRSKDDCYHDAQHHRDNEFELSLAADTRFDQPNPHGVTTGCCPDPVATRYPKTFRGLGGVTR